MNSLSILVCFLNWFLNLCSCISKITINRSDCKCMLLSPCIDDWAWLTNRIKLKIIPLHDLSFLLLGIKCVILLTNLLQKICWRCLFKIVTLWHWQITSFTKKNYKTINKKFITKKSYNNWTIFNDPIHYKKREYHLFWDLLILKWASQFLLV